MMLLRKPDKIHKEPPRPPQPEFLDPPPAKEELKAGIREFLEQPFLRIAVVAVVVIVLSVVLFYPHSEPKEQKTAADTDEKRVLVTTSTMERAIEGSAKGRKRNEPKPEDVRKPREKRKYDNVMAVFVAKPGDPAKINPVKEDHFRGISFGVPSGTKVPALLSNRVFSFNIEAPVIALVAKDFTYHDKVVIPKDSQFLGQADVLKSVDRINVRFDLLILPDGREIKVRGLALAEDGSGGIRGKVDKHTDRKILKAVGETLLAGASLFVGAKQTDPFSLEDQIRLNLTQNLTNEAARDLRSSKIEKSVTVEAYTPIQVILLDAV